MWGNILQQILPAVDAREAQIPPPDRDGMNYVTSMPMPDSDVNRMVVSQQNIGATPAAMKKQAQNQAVEQKQVEKQENDYKKLVRNFMAKREGIALDGENRLKKLESEYAAQGADLAPLMNWVDSQTGNNLNLRKQYDSTRITPQQMEQLRSKLGAEQTNNYGQMTDDAQNMLRMDMMEKQYAEANKARKLKALMGIGGAGGRKLGADDIKRLGYITSMQTGLGSISEIMGSGNAPSSIQTIAALKSGVVGDNDLSRRLRDVAESFGRMQSGGAINKEEEKRFLDSLYKFGDSEQMVKDKILTKIKEVNDRELQLYWGKDWKSKKGKSNMSLGSQSKPPQQYDPNNAEFKAWKQSQGM